MTTPQTTIIWDFDNTLFETKRFWREELFPAFKHLNVDAQTVEQVFKKATGGEGGNPDYFVPSILAREIQTSTGIGQPELLAVIESIVYSDRGKSYFFTEARESVGLARKKGYHNLLVSYGDPDFKSRWFESIGVFEQFRPDDVYITAEKKIEIIPLLPLSDAVIIVNDVLAETQEAMDVLAKNGHTVASYHFVSDDKTLGNKAQANITTISCFKAFQTQL